jgi:PAS domain-containing protein
MVGVWEWNIQTNELMWDKRMHALFNTDVLTFGNNFEAFLQCVIPEDRGQVQSKVTDAVEHDAPYNFCFRLTTCPRIIRGRGRLIRDKNKRPLRMIGVCVEDFGQEKRCLSECPYRLEHLPPPPRVGRITLDPACPVDLPKASS